MSPEAGDAQFPLSRRSYPRRLGKAKVSKRRKVLKPQPDVESVWSLVTNHRATSSRVGWLSQEGCLKEVAAPRTGLDSGQPFVPRAPCETVCMWKRRLVPKNGQPKVCRKKGKLVHVPREDGGKQFGLGQVNHVPTTMFDVPLYGG